MDSTDPHILQTLRTKLRSWEIRFETKFGRLPSQDDIRSFPPIHEKYKTYSKLKKQTTSLPPKPSPFETPSKQSKHPHSASKKTTLTPSRKPKSPYVASIHAVLKHTKSPYKTTQTPTSRFSASPSTNRSAKSGSKFLQALQEVKRESDRKKPFSDLLRDVESGKVDAGHNRGWVSRDEVMRKRDRDEVMRKSGLDLLDFEETLRRDGDERKPFTLLNKFSDPNLLG
ncbi:hypothetical protein BC829DRAFT_41498 [Chytridium lagenaria]|nr:hypothetical protein BC829DRAFT_41498 [Chytridium lagenaria]